MGTGLVFRWSATPPPQGGRIPEFSTFGGSFLFKHTPYDAELPNFTW